MDFDQTLKLFDSFWFETDIVFKNLTYPSTPSFSSSNPSHQFLRYSCPSSQKKLKGTLSDKETTNTREYEDEEDEDEEDGDGDGDGENRGGKNDGRLRKMRLSELELEELKGCMDLGFVFPEEDRDPRLVYLIPALQRLRRRNRSSEGDGNEDRNSTDVSEILEPYLSEAWEAMEDETKKTRKKKKSPLMEWRFSGWNHQMNIKDNLRLWAYTVASTVR